MRSSKASDPKLFFDSLQTQFEHVVNQGKSTEIMPEKLEKMQRELDHDLDKLFFQPDFVTQKRFSRPDQLKKEGDVLPKKHRSSKSYLAATTNETASSSIGGSPSYFNALTAVFSVASIMILAVSWSLWPASHWNWPYAPPEMQRVDIAGSVASAEMLDSTVPVVSTETLDSTVPVASTEMLDSTEPVVSAEMLDSTASVASTEVADTAPDKSNLLNTMLAANPAGAGNNAVLVQQNPVVENILEIVSPIGRIRSEPGLHGKVVARLERGSLVVELGRQGDWFRVRLSDNQEAWAYKNIVRRQ